MKSISSLLAVGVLFAASNVAAYGASNPGAVVYKGCFSTSTGLSMNSSFMYNTEGYCQKQCAPIGKLTLATAKATDCYCGDELPPSSAKVDDKFCDTGCAGFDQSKCGGQKYWSVYLSGVSASADEAAAVSSSSSSSSSASGPTPTTPAKPAMTTIQGETIVVTAAPNANTASPSATAAASSGGGGGPSTAGIAAGVVVGIVAAAAIAGGLYLFIRNRKRRQVEEEFRQNAAVSSFIGSGKPPSSSSGASDTRLEPSVMAQRRMSDGSIADNQDYSRRILKVTNA